MKTESYSLEHVDAMIDFLDKQIAAGTDTPAMLNVLQQRLDIIDMTYKHDPRVEQFYPQMLELQALIHGRRNDDDKAMQFMKEAVRQTGGVKGIHSQTIRQYIATHSHSRPTTVAAAHPRRKHKFALPLRLKSRNTKVAFAAVFGLLVISVTALHFVPQVGALPTLLTNHSQIDNAKNNFDKLTREYDQCSAQLAQERSSVNTSDQNAIDAYNNATKQCQTIQQEQNQAATRYNSLIGAH